MPTPKGTPMAKSLPPIILETIKKNPGIGSRTLAYRLAEQHDYRAASVQSLVSEMGKAGEFVRVRVHGKGAINTEGFYFCWPETPAGVSPADLIPLGHPTKHREPKKAVKQTPAPKPKRVEAQSLKEIVRTQDTPAPVFTGTAVRGGQVGYTPHPYDTKVESISLTPVTNGAQGEVQADITVTIRKGEHTTIVSSRVDVHVPVQLFAAHVLSFVAAVLDHPLR